MRHRADSRPSLLRRAEPRCAPLPRLLRARSPTTRPHLPAPPRLSEPPGPARAAYPRSPAPPPARTPPSPPRCAWTGTSSAGGPSSAGSPSAGAGCWPAPGAPRPRGCRCPWQQPTDLARRRRGSRRGRRPPVGRGARGRRAEREAARPARRDPGLRLGPREAGRRQGGGGAAVREGRAGGCGSCYCGRRGRVDSQLKSRFLEDND